MEENQRLVKIVKEQVAFIEALEKEYAGITQIKKDDEGEAINR